MLQLATNSKILLAISHVDFRKGIDALSALCKTVLEQDPFSGTVFLFRNRGATAVRILYYDGQGFWLCTKRWSSGKLNWWPKAIDTAQYISTAKLNILLHNGNPDSAGLADDWRKLPNQAA